MKLINAGQFLCQTLQAVEQCRIISRKPKSGFLKTIAVIVLQEHASLGEQWTRR